MSNGKKETLNLMLTEIILVISKECVYITGSHSHQHTALKAVVMDTLWGIVIPYTLLPNYTSLAGCIEDCNSYADRLFYMQWNLPGEGQEVVLSEKEAFPVREATLHDQTTNTEMGESDKKMTTS